MFKKVLVAEDYESASISVQKALEDLQIMNAEYVNYCDDAFHLIKKSISEKEPFDLLITDLSFEEDHRQQDLKSGVELIAETKKALPQLKTLVFSVEKKPQIIKALFDDQNIDGFVNKGRQDVHELKRAINTIYKNEKYISHENIVNLRRNTIELTTIEYNIIRSLSEGILQKNIPDVLKSKKLKPCSLSSVEKSLNQLKDNFRANNNEQLIAICKDLGII